MFVNKLNTLSTVYCEHFIFFFLFNKYFKSLLFFLIDLMRKIYRKKLNKVLKIIIDTQHNQQQTVFR